MECFVVVNDILKFVVSCRFGCLVGGGKIVILWCSVCVRLCVLCGFILGSKRINFLLF